METLAFLDLALAYEDPNPSPNLRFKDTDLRAASSVAMGFIASGIVASTLTYADAARATLYYGSRGSDVAKLQEALGNIPVDGIFGRETLARLKSYQAKKGLMVDGIAGPETLSSLGWSSPSKNSQGQDVGIGKGQDEPEQYGKLHLINDTPYMAIVLLYEPGNEHSSRYAYIPPCYQRTLLDTYSSSWKVSFNQSKKFSIAEKSDRKNNVFEVKLSKLSQEDTQLCEYDDSRDLKAKPVRLDWLDSVARLTDRLRIDEIAKSNFDNLFAAPRVFSRLFSQMPDKEKKTLAGEGQDVEDATNVIIGRLVRQDNVVSDPHPYLYKDVGNKLRMKYIEGELDLNNPYDPDKGINTYLKKWQDDCEKISLDVDLTYELIYKIEYYLEKSIQVEEEITKHLDTINPNPASPTGSAEDTENAEALRSEICKFAQRQHPIFVNSGTQSQRIPKKCI
ncbi:MAG: peptidoglycan-binding protein [Coleofasciculus sp. S288]|nr:peptidoglycan-binding protein [Coleofasciculus sp. S288]